MPNAWMEHVRQFRKQNRHLSYKQLLSEAKNTYGGGPVGNDSPSSLTRSASHVGGSVTGYESPSSLTRSASKVGGSRRRRGGSKMNMNNLLKSGTNTLKQAGHMIKGKMGGSKMNLNHLLKNSTNTLKQAGHAIKGKLGGRKSRRRRR